MRRREDGGNQLTLNSKATVQIPVIYLRSLSLLTLTTAFVCALLPANRLIGVVPLGGYLIHLLTFMILGLFLDLSYAAKSVLSKVSFLALFGAFIEVAQSFVPHRSSSFLDFIVDGAGILIYFLLLRWLAQRFLFPFVPGLAVTLVS